MRQGIAEGMEAWDRRRPRLPVLAALLLVSTALGACGSACSRVSTLVDIQVLTTHPEEYGGTRVCTEGILVSGPEANALGSSSYEEHGAIRLTGPVVWVEKAEIRRRSDCFTTQTPPHPSYEFCRVQVCGRFDYGEKYGHAGCCDYQLGAWP